MMYLAVIIVAFSICIGYYYREDYQSMETVQAHVEGDMITFHLLVVFILIRRAELDMGTHFPYLSHQSSDYDYL